MDAHTLLVLQYPQVLELLERCTATPQGRQFAAALTPSPWPETVAERLRETAEARTVLHAAGGFPFAGISDVGPLVRSAELERQLTPTELLAVMRTVAAGRQLRSFLHARAAVAPLLAGLAAGLPLLPILEQRIEESVSSEGEVKDTASPELRRLRTQIGIVTQRLTNKLNEILASSRSSTWIQEFVVTIREERYCIPVKSEYVKAFGGVAHDVSQSGATVFVEPATIVPIGNELKQLRAQQQQEIQRILRELTGLVAASAAALHSLASIAGHLDLVHAKARLAADMDAAEPALNSAGSLRFEGARHPLLPDPVTPIDIELGRTFRTLLITGPNTGGKTAALKTVGLLSLMLQAGLQIPVREGSVAAVFPAVFADIGDEQDLRQSLSTFSAHLKNIASILHNLEPGSLVLLDEIGAGTDPAEGAALARAILDALLAQNALTVATSHYGELKEYAYGTPGVLNASVEFDRDTLSPTYHILQGTPGSSHAFHIAARLGLPEELITQARDSLSKRDQDAGQLLEQIETATRAARGAQVEAERDRDAAAELRNTYEERVRQATELRANVQAEARAEARQVLQQTRTRAEALLKQIEKRGTSPGRPRTAQQNIERLETETWAHFTREAPAAPEPEAQSDDREPLRKGDVVRVITLNLDGQLLEDPVNGQAPLIVGAMRVTLPVGQLRRLAKQEAKRAEKQAAAAGPSDGAREIAMRKAMTIAPELMLRAMRVEEALPLLDKYLDDAFAAGMHTARIIHGKGTGVLRRVVSEQLQQHPLVESYRIGESSEGGEGATVVVFKT